MKIRFIETDFNTYIELGGVMVGYFTKRYNGNLMCSFMSEQPLKLDELAEIYDKMEELNGA